MAYEVPALGTAGQVYTAAAHNIIVEDIRMFSVFANEAARDAAITSPTEGMHAYLTAPTVPAATGTTTAIPIGVQTIYNGVAWVCVTPVGSGSNNTASTTSTSFVTTLTGDGTAISVTLVTGTTVRLDMFLIGSNSSAATQFVTYSVSGATTVSAALTDGAWARIGSATDFSLSRGRVITGLTAGTNTFTLNYRTDAGTFTINSRSLIVVGIA